MQDSTEAAVLPRLFCCAKFVEVLQGVGAVASAAEDSIKALLSFWNMKKEQWHYQIDMIFCKGLNILNAKIRLFFYNYPSQNFLCFLMLFCWCLVVWVHECKGAATWQPLFMVHFLRDHLRFLRVLWQKRREGRCHRCARTSLFHAELDLTVCDL